MGCKIVVALLVILLAHGSANSAETITSDLIAKAKSEGEVVWYSTLPVPETQTWAALFSKEYG